MISSAGRALHHFAEFIVCEGDVRSAGEHSAAVEDAKPLFGQVSRIIDDAGHSLVFDNVRGDGPGRIEHDISDRRAKDRGLVKGLPNHDLAGPGQGVVVVILQPEAGDVDDEVGAGHVVNHPAGSLQVHPDLFDPFGDRNVHGGNDADLDVGKGHAIGQEQGEQGGKLAAQGDLHRTGRNSHYKKTGFPVAGGIT